MPNKKFKSSYHPGDSDRIDPDCWVTSQDRTKMVQAICPPRGEDDPRYMETIVWIYGDPDDRFFVTIIDQQTGQSATAWNEYLSNAEYHAKAQIGIPVPVAP
jgi:hypothetical protein